MKPLFQYFQLPKVRGHPPSFPHEICSANDRRLQWLKSYPLALFDLKGNPLAWSIQLDARDYFAFAWNACVSRWIKNPDRFPEYISWPFLGRKEYGAVESADSIDPVCHFGGYIDGENLPKQDFTSPDNFFTRFRNLLVSGPVFTLKSLHTHGFSICDMGVADLYSCALEVFNGQIVPHRISPFDSYTVIDPHFEYYAIPSHCTSAEKSRAANELIGEQHDVKWSINFDRLSAYGVLELIDMRFFELLTGIPIRHNVKLATINHSFRAAAHLRGSGVYRRLNIKGPPSELRTTSKYANELIGIDANWSIRSKLDADAIRQLTIQWRKNNGEGDNLFAPSIKDAWQWK